MPPATGDESGFPDTDPFVPVSFRILAGISPDDVALLEEIIDDSLHQIHRLRDALICNEPLAKAAALMGVDRFLAQFDAPLPLE